MTDRTEAQGLRALIADDAYAMSFQTLGQYRAALLKAAEAPQAQPAAAVPDIDALAQFIRKVDGTHHMGAGALAERIVEWLLATPHPTGEPQAQPEPDSACVICPECSHQFRAIPCDVQRLMLDAGFEPPFTAPPSQAEAQVDAELLDWAERNLLYVHQDMGEEFSVTYLNCFGGQNIITGKGLRDCLLAARAKDKAQ
jgi:hypothetical protein